MGPYMTVKNLEFRHRLLLSDDAVVLGPVAGSAESAPDDGGKDDPIEVGDDQLVVSSPDALHTSSSCPKLVPGRCGGAGRQRGTSAVDPLADPFSRWCSNWSPRSGCAPRSLCGVAVWNVEDASRPRRPRPSRVGFGGCARNRRARGRCQPAAGSARGCPRPGRGQAGRHRMTGPAGGEVDPGGPPTRNRPGEITTDTCQQVGSDRAAAELCGTTNKTVRCLIERAQATLAGGGTTTTTTTSTAARELRRHRRTRRRTRAGVEGEDLR